MKQVYGLRIFLALILVALIIASTAAYFAFAIARIFYANENGVRLDPFALSYYPQVAIPTVTNSKRLVFFGDSRAESWPTPLDVSGWEFINRGISGQTTPQILGRFNAHVTPLQPQVIVLQLGINDLNAIPISPTSRTVIIANDLANIQSIIQQANDLGSVVILSTIFPVADPPFVRSIFYWSNDIPRAAREINDHLRNLANERVIILDADLILLDVNGRVRSEYMEDYIHLNRAGYDALNLRLSQLVSALSP